MRRESALVSNPVLTAIGLKKSYGGVHAVEDVSFDIAPGAIMAIIGPNGAGKSTTFNMVGGQVKPDAGSIILNGRSISGLPPRAIWRRGVGRTFQIAATFASMTVMENVQMALISHQGGLFDMIRRAGGRCRDEAIAVLDRVGIKNLAERPCATLAYGDVKRVELAIAVAGDPIMLLMDEPTAGMAPGERGDLMNLVARIAREKKMAILFTEHDMDTVFAHADRVLVLDRGRIIADGPPGAVRENADVRTVYLGRSKNGRRKAGQPESRQPQKKPPETDPSESKAAKPDTANAVTSPAKSGPV